MNGLQYKNKDGDEQTQNEEKRRRRRLKMFRKHLKIVF